MGVTVTLPHHIGGPAAWVSVCERIDRPPVETPPLGLRVGARVTASLSYFQAQPCVWFCFVLAFFFALFCFILFCFALLCRAGCCDTGSGRGALCRLPASASLPRAVRGTSSAWPLSESTFCLLTDLVVLLVSVPAFPCREQLA